MKLTIIHRHPIVESIKSLRIESFSNIFSCFLISCFNADSMFIDFVGFFISKLTIFIINNINCIIVYDSVKIERNCSIPCCACEIQYVIIIRNMEILGYELLRMLIHICVMG